MEPMGMESCTFVHVEVAVEDPTAAAEYLKEVFGAVDCEPGIVRFISDAYEVPEGGLRHVMLGGVVFQLTTGWVDQRAIHGNHIHNINVMVKDIDGVVNKMTSRGSTIGILDVPDLPFLGVQGDSPQRLVLVDGTAQCGMKFEMEPYNPEYTPGEDPPARR